MADIAKIRSELLAAMGDDPTNAVTDAIHQLVTVAAERIAEARRERDLAVAHDRQPYPTAWAYEKACEIIRARDAELAELREHHGHCLTAAAPQPERAKPGDTVRGYGGAQFPLVEGEVVEDEHINGRGWLAVRQPGEPTPYAVLPESVEVVERALEQPEEAARA